MEEFSDIVEQYTPMINRIIRSLMIYKDQDDYFQIGLIALWDAYSLYDPEKGSFLSIAYSMVKGRILHGLRDEAKTNLLVSPFEPGSGQIEETLITEDKPLQHEYLLAYCEGLTESQKNWVLLTFDAQLSISEIAVQQNVTIAAVKSWRRSTLKKLKTSLNSH
ncbi:sigma-70 family RNA polymerase sigma factor [Peribacillus psychrosaccharolyticus]|uniref:Sigma-70 family RNA polymerase sigma factor n=1 Tax=Peribacillus psychrosaccharolyticus TaxID=1407 RepID=A0A974NQ02_PERPY|nr:sigma-70 family RNA polymerase sigma factor [Peribacillus psychrosaccharolyticus]MEC2057564.1 sigma-70 family RNA polymerase sigma factor [Peribacillus psychrosaccharolyticus]MED3746020.1 sigma-70 family RNA polymerase sigma factor [Peribacillus psychrosaccharolyticus]QQT01724.1 sigma-70 family RNA polymerase sigma factor [Peribacillus psychrosaccharolyticus]